MNTHDLANLTLMQLLHRRVVVWRIGRLMRRARRLAGRVERLWNTINMEVPL